jgi:photosystem II stability/assembly factor-like uncharacterized protein
MRLSSVRGSVFLPLLAAALQLIGTPFDTEGQATPTEATFGNLTFRNIGPATMSGRVDDLAVLESNPSIYYVATATGGLWKTINNGTTWEVLFDDQDVVSIGDVAIAQDDASLVWVGTGENNNRQSSSWGGGVYKSTDGGHTWRNMGLEDTRHIARIIVDPRDHDVVYVAALGHLWGSNETRGVFKTTDGGVSWIKVLYVDEFTGATELVMDPSNNKVLYAATYQRQRSSWGFNGGGPGSAIYKSSDAGVTWTKLTNGIPEGDLGRIGLDVYRKDPRVVYARIQHETESGVYRSDDGGSNWTKMSDTNPRPMYFSQIRIDPNDDHRIYVLGVELHMSDDGGKTFVGTTVPHSDHHALWIDPADSNHVITGCDGGVNVSYDRGATWDFVDNMDLGQFYHVSYDMDTPYNVYGGLQDNASWGGPSAVRSQYGIGNFDWFNIGSGDGFVTIVDPTDSRTIYAESQGGNMFRVDRDSKERKVIKPQPQRGEPDLQWYWDAPMQISPHASSTLFVAANKVFKSTDRGSSWTAVSPDLTARIDRDEMTLMGVASSDFTIAANDGVSSYGTIVTFAESPVREGLYYAGADDGTVQVTRDGGLGWTDITERFPRLPDRAFVSRVTPSAFDEATVYATFDNHRADDYRPYIYVSSDYGESWRSIADGMPDGQVVRDITEDLVNRNVLYVGTELGLFVTLDRGGQWTRVTANLPTVPIAEITLHPRDNDMILGTHGRSVWILDDLTPFQQAAEALEREAFMFEIPTAEQSNPGAFRPNFAGPGDRRFWGDNPPAGAAIAYYLASAADELSITIQDGQGNAVRTISGGILEEHRAVGINRVYWDLRYAPLPTTGGGAGGRGNANAPFVMPGDYSVSVVADGGAIGTRSVRVIGDRVIEITNADRNLLHDASLTLHELQSTANETGEAVGALSERLSAIGETLDEADDVPVSVRTMFDEVENLVTDFGRRLGDGGRGRRGASTIRGQISSVKRQLMASTSAPTEVQLRISREVEQDLALVVEEVNRVIGDSMPALYRALAEDNLLLTVKPIGRVRPNGM